MHLSGPFSCMNKPLDHQQSVSEMGDHHERRSGLILVKSGWGRCCDKHWLLHAGAELQGARREWRQSKLEDSGDDLQVWDLDKPGPGTDL